MMLAFRNPDTGEVAIAPASDGYGLPWRALPDPPALDGWAWNNANNSWVAAPMPMMPEQLWQLLTLAEHVAARASNDTLVAVAFDRINARRHALPLNDGNFIALVLRLQELQVLTHDRAIQVLAGRFPE
jgi:hypothetical protein